MMVVRREKTQQVVCFLAVMFILCFASIYTNFKSRSNVVSSVNEESRAVSSSSDEICYLPDGDKFRRNHLRKLIIKSVSTESAYLSENDASKVLFLPRNYSNLSEFIEVTRSALMARRIIPKTLSIWTIFHNPPYKDMVRPSCDGLWMEFGVFQGQTLKKMANWSAKFCGKSSQPVYGFDTFEGLPADWKPGYKRGHFRINNWTELSVPSNTVLVKGLFIDTLPNQLTLIDKKYGCNMPVSFVHIDCDLYEGTRDILFLLGSRLVPGSILVFDELFNYPTYEKYEIKAFYEFLAGTNMRLMPIGASVDIELNPTRNIRPQSFGFVVY